VRHHFALEIRCWLWHTTALDGQRPRRETDAYDTLIFRTHRRRPVELPTERLAVHVRDRFRRTDEKSRTTRVTKTRITGGRARKPLRQQWQEGRKGPDHRKKDHCNRDSACAARMKCVRMTRVVGFDSIACARARRTAELCLKFGMRSARIELFYIVNVQKQLDAALCNCLPRDAKRNARPFANFYQKSGCRHSSVTEHASRKDETEV
jgi:hypothetical protein